MFVCHLRVLLIIDYIFLSSAVILMHDIYVKLAICACILWSIFIFSDDKWPFRESFVPPQNKPPFFNVRNVDDCSDDIAMTHPNGSHVNSPYISVCVSLVYCFYNNL